MIMNGILVGADEVLITIADVGGEGMAEVVVEIWTGGESSSGLAGTKTLFVTPLTLTKTLWKRLPLFEELSSGVGMTGVGKRLPLLEELSSGVGKTGVGKRLPLFEELSSGVATESDSDMVDISSLQNK